MNSILALDPIFIKIGSLEIRWYAVFILTGALLAYFISRQLFKKNGYSADVLDNIFLISFPMGIVGARLWFVLSNLDLYKNNFWGAFALWDGGLAIQGGVVLGALSGILYLRKFHKEIPILHAVDLIVPNILVAQAIGRWGNFMNQEVYGAYIERSKLWFLPNFILDQMDVPGAPSGMVAQPLFLYESLLTLTSFIIISVVLRKFWKNRKNGSLCALYFIFYGVIRASLELLRNPIYVMEMFGLPTSVVTSIVYIALGIGLLVYIYFFHDKKKKVEE